MRAGLAGRVARVRAVVPEGCRVCRGRQPVRFLVDGERRSSRFDPVDHMMGSAIAHRAPTC